MRIRRFDRRAMALLIVVALHLALLRLLQGAGATHIEPAAVAPRVTLRLIPVALPLPRAPAAPTTLPARITTSSAAVGRSHTRTSASSSAPDAITPPTIETAAHADAPASAPDHPPSLLDTEATRRAIRASARAPSLGDQLARARDEPDRVSAHERLAHSVKEAGKGDCIKGEFAGAGMGLLSLPFLAVAAASGDCAK